MTRPALRTIHPQAGAGPGGATAAGSMLTGVSAPSSPMIWSRSELSGKLTSVSKSRRNCDDWFCGRVYSGITVAGSSWSTSSGIPSCWRRDDWRRVTNVAPAWSVCQ